MHCIANSVNYVHVHFQREPSIGIADGVAERTLLLLINLTSQLSKTVCCLEIGKNSHVNTRTYEENRIEK